MSDTIPAILYAAKSTEDRRGSIPDQLDEARAMAEHEGWQVVGEYYDDGFSAYRGNRGPDLEAAKRAAAKAAADYGTTCMLVGWRADRFARGAGDAPGAADSLVEIWHQMRRQNVHLRTVRNDYAMHDPVLLAVEAKRIHEESKQRSADVEKGMLRRAKRGQAHGGPRPYGYERELAEQPKAGERLQYRLVAERGRGSGRAEGVQGVLRRNEPAADCPRPHRQRSAHHERR